MTSVIRGVGGALVAVLLCAGWAAGQEESAPASNGRALLVEWLGSGTTSFVVSALYLGAFEEGACGDDLECTFTALGGLAILSTGASVLGVAIADRLASTDASLWGAGVGAVAGTVGGFLVANHWADHNDFTRALSLGFTQGLAAAIGSRIGVALR